VRKFCVLLATVGWSTYAVGPVLAQSTSGDTRVAELIAAARANAQVTEASRGFDLRVDDAVRLALEHNLDLAVERLNPQLSDLSIAQADANYQPALTSSFGNRATVRLPTSQLNGGQRVQNDILTYNGGFGQNMKWGGGSYALTFNNNRNVTTDTFSNFNPSYTSTFTAAYTQPILRGFSIDANRQQLIVSRINRDISDVQLRATVTNTLASVRNAYWDLVFTIEAISVARRYLDLAEKLVEDNEQRVEVGTMAPIDVVQAQAEAASRRQTLAQAEAQWRTAELALKRLIVNSTEDPLWRARLNPVDRPVYQPEPIDIEAAVRTALDKRTDLAQAKRQLESNDVSLRFLRNQTLPALDLVASYGLQGVGGTQFQRQGSGLGSQIIGTIPGGYLDALQAITNRNYPTWNLQVNFSYPIGASTFDAQYERAKVQNNQSLTEIRSLELQVATEVTNAALQVQSNRERVEAATAARELAQRRLEAEESKFEVGMSTNFFVVQAQRDLADAVNTELRARLDHQKSLVDFERVQETSLSRAGITVTTGGGNVGGQGSRQSVATGGGGGQP
jgi:outer membrane protein TolC